MKNNKIIYVCDLKNNKMNTHVTHQSAWETEHCLRFLSPLYALLHCILLLPRKTELPCRNFVFLDCFLTYGFEFYMESFCMNFFEPDFSVGCVCGIYPCWYCSCSKYSFSPMCSFPFYDYTAIYEAKYPICIPLSPGNQQHPGFNTCYRRAKSDLVSSIIWE